MADGTSTTTGERRSEEIRRDIEQTRADMDETVDELSGRLSPGRLLDEVWHRVRDGGADGIGSVVRDHPVPLALMGLGLGWLAIEQATGRGGEDRRHPGAGTMAPAEGRRGPYGPDAVDHDDPDWEHAGAGTRLKGAASDAADRAAGAKEKVSGAASAVKDRVSDAATSAKESVSGAAASARARAGRLEERATGAAGRAATAAGDTARRAKQGFWEQMEDNPLAMGAVAFGLGLASGLSFPSSDTEDRLLGRTSDTVKDEAKRVGRETARKTRRVAEDAADAAADEVRRQREERDIEGAARESAEHAKEAAARAAGEVGEAAREVGRAAKEAARTRAEEEGLTAEGVKDEARRAGQRTREEAARDVGRAKDEDGP